MSHSAASDVTAATNITVTRVPLPVSDAAQRYALVLDNVFSAAEMQQWVATVDAKGFERALLNIGYLNRRMLYEFSEFCNCLTSSLF